MNDTDDWYDVEEINSYTYCITEEGEYEGVFPAQMYLITGEDRALLLDAGLGIGDLHELASELVDVPVTLLLTHSHWDHRGAAASFEDVMIHENECTSDGMVTDNVVVTDSGAGPETFVEQWIEADRAFPDGFDPVSFAIEPVTGVKPINPPMEIALGSRTLEVVFIPGHSPGQVGVLDRNAKTFYGADILHRDHTTLLHVGGCDVEAHLESLRRIRALRDENAFDHLYIAHDRPLGPDELSLLDDLIDSIEDALAGNVEVEVFDTSMGEAYQFDVRGTTVLSHPF